MMIGSALMENERTVSAMYDELIDALQCTRHFALYQDCYERNCYANSGKGLYCNIPKLMADAADAIERLQKQNEELQERWSAATIEGFPVNDLILFAQVCRKNGVREKDLQAFAWNMEKALEIVRKEFDEALHRSMERTFLYGTELNDACRKQNREEKPNEKDTDTI